MPDSEEKKGTADPSAKLPVQRSETAPAEPSRVGTGVLALLLWVWADEDWFRRAP